MHTGHYSFVAIALLAATSGAAEDLHRHLLRYHVTEIEAPADANDGCVPGFYHSMFARELNESVQLVGAHNCHMATGNPAEPYLPRGPRAFRWTRQTGAVQLPAVDSTVSGPYQGRFAVAINESGLASGWESMSNDGSAATIWPLSGGAAHAFTPVTCDAWFNTPFAISYGLNDLGTVTALDLRIDENGSCDFHMIAKRANGEELVGPRGTPREINNQDVVVGNANNQAVKWLPATNVVIPLPLSNPADSSMARSINELNQAVGYAHHDDGTCPGGSDAKLWMADNTDITLPALAGATMSAALDINIHGDIVGESGVPDLSLPCDFVDPFASTAVLWRGGAVYDLNTLVPATFAAEVQLISAPAINDRGQILARGVRPGEPKLPCPDFVYNVTTGESNYDSTLMCQPEYSFLLTPRRWH